MLPSVLEIVDAVGAMTGFDPRRIYGASKSPEVLRRRSMVFWIARHFGHDMLDTCDALGVYRELKTWRRALNRVWDKGLTSDAKRIADAIALGTVNAQDPDPYCALEEGDPGPPLDPATVPDYRHPPGEIERRKAEVRARLGP